LFLGSDLVWMRQVYGSGSTAGVSLKVDLTL